MKACFVTNCVSANGDDINAMCDRAREISLATFKRRCDWREIAAMLGYGRTFPIDKDWHVRYHRSRYRGVPCYYLVHSAIEYVFVSAPVDT